MRTTTRPRLNRQPCSGIPGNLLQTDVAADTLQQRQRQIAGDTLPRLIASGQRTHHQIDPGQRNPTQDKGIRWYSDQTSSEATGGNTATITNTRQHPASALLPPGINRCGVLFGFQRTCSSGNALTQQYAAGAQFYQPWRQLGAAHRHRAISEIGQQSQRNTANPAAGAN